VTEFSKLVTKDIPLLQYRTGYEDVSF